MIPRGVHVARRNSNHDLVIFDHDMCESNPNVNNTNIGFALGGSKDINSFRININNHKIPSSDSITFEGIFGECYFDTSPIIDENDYKNDIGDNKGIKSNEGEMEDKMDDDINAEMDDKQLPLFYPSYSYSKSIIPNCLRKDNATTTRVCKQCNKTINIF